MKKQPKFSDQNINDFLSKADVPLKKDKELIWTEKFNSHLIDSHCQLLLSALFFSSALTPYSVYVTGSLVAVFLNTFC